MDPWFPWRCMGCNRAAEGAWAQYLALLDEGYAEGDALWCLELDWSCCQLGVRGFCSVHFREEYSRWLTKSQ